MKFLVAINRRAAGGNALRLLPELKRIARHGSHTYEWQVTQSPQEMQLAISGAARAGVEGIILAGGDGTISHALPALLSSGLPLGVIPCGRGNDFVRNVGLPLNVREAVVYPDRPQRRTIDIPAANGVPYASVACLGLDARVNELAGRPRKYLGARTTYVYAALRAIMSFKPFDVEIDLDGQTFGSSIMLAALANGCCYGGGMKIAPSANMTDGLLNVCIVSRTGKLTLLKEFPKVFKGRHTGHPSVTSVTARSVRITSDTNQSVFADGERIAKLPLTCSVDGQQLQILLPTGIS